MFYIVTKRVFNKITYRLSLSCIEFKSNRRHTVEQSSPLMAKEYSIYLIHLDISLSSENVYLNICLLIIILCYFVLLFYRVRHANTQ